jgi:hypothetical protein
MQLYYERSLMVAADQRCNLFSPALKAALASAQAQARGAALRGGSDEAALLRTHANAQGKARATACNSPDITVASARVRKAFDGYSRLQRMTFAGEKADWRAHRIVSPDAVSWRLTQKLSAGRDRVLFGLGGQGPGQQVMATASFADGSWPYAARLVIRDITRTPLPQPHRLKAGSPLAGRAPPRAGARIVMAEGRSLADVRLLPQGAKSGVLFRFPSTTADMLQGLDPRETVALEFVFDGRSSDPVRTVHVEVGDFAAGQAFLKVPR